MPTRSALPQVLSIRPLPQAPHVSIRLPGSKSLTNRALLCAALADGTSTLRGALLADDTRAMIAAVAGLGADVSVDEESGTVTVTGTDLRHRTSGLLIDGRQSGTTSRFVLPVLALMAGRSVLDGSEQLRARPFDHLVSALRELGAEVTENGEPGRLPLAVSGPVPGGRVRLPGHVSSQFLSGLLIAGPLMAAGLTVDLTSDPVSVPYLTMTLAVMTAFGAEAGQWYARPGRYQACDYPVEADASAASYFFGAAAVTGGTITVQGLGRPSLQGDLAFAEVLERMGAGVEYGPDQVTVTGPAQLHGVDVTMTDISDTAQTLAAVAVFADSPTRVRGIGFIRGKETDRIKAIVTQLRRAGIDAVEHDDGFTVRPGTPVPTRFATYDDHRMAMSLALLGLRSPGIEIADPGCVAKTYPDFFTDLARLAEAG